MNLNINATINMYNHTDRALLEAIASDLKAVKVLVTQLGVKLMASLNDLETQVKANTDVEASALLLIQGIVAQLEAAKMDPVRLQAVIDSLKASADPLSAAVVANTPAA